MTWSGTRGDPRSRMELRRDIEGMRALAVLLVLFGHAGLGLLPGGFVGVDVFLVISGFLITQLLLGEVDRTGRISLSGFYARRARRLLPAAAVVIVASLLLAYLFLPAGRWSDTGWDAFASGMHAMNWRLGAGDTGYLAADDGASILQHLWALAVGVQFLLLWPVLLLGIAWTARRRTDRLRRHLLIGIGSVAVASFVGSVHLTRTDPTAAFFGTTRLWELALGGALAVLSPGLARLAPRLAAWIGWAGVAAIVLAALVLEPSRSFPGFPALLPTLGAAAILIAGTRRTVTGAGAGTGSGPARVGPGALLGTRWAGAVGAVSYALYLWHWPLLVAADVRFGALNPGAVLGVLLLAALLAVLTHRYAEQPIRLAKGLGVSPARALRLSAPFVILPVLAGVLFQFTVWPPAQDQVPAAAFPPPASPTADGTPEPGPVAPGAAALPGSPRDARAGRPVDKVPTITPDPTVADEDLADVHRHDCISKPTKTEPLTCVYGVREAEFTVALAGDTQAVNWVPALQAVAAENGWRLVTYLKSGCPFLDIRVSQYNLPQPECAEWFGKVRTALTGAERPDLLVMSNHDYLPMRDGKVVVGDDVDDELIDGMRRTWKGLRAAKLPTVLLRETPTMQLHVAECVAQNRERLRRCASERDEAFEAGVGPAQAKAAEDQPGVHLVDLNDAICPTDRCAPVIGGVLVYRDHANLTASYARSLAPRLGEALKRVVN